MPFQPDDSMLVKAFDGAIRSYRESQKKGLHVEEKAQKKQKT
jgi:hypothetical protein